jgi:hypothetical protein
MEDALGVQQSRDVLEHPFQDGLEVFDQRLRKVSYRLGLARHERIKGKSRSAFAMSRDSRQALVVA